MKDIFSSIWRVAFTLVLVLSMGLTSLLSVTSPALAATVPPLGTAGNYAVLAGTTITNTGTTAIVGGDVGVAPLSAITGFPPGTVLLPNIKHPGNDAPTQQAKIDLITAYNDAAGQGPATTLTGDLGGQVLTAGVYTYPSSAGLTGTLTLTGSATDIWIFQIGSTLTTATDSRVVFTGGGLPCNVFWQVGTSATFGTNSDISGNVLALVSITMNTGAKLAGRALARNGAVTLDTNAITVCATCKPITIASAPDPLPAGTILVAYGPVTFTASGGTAPYVYSVPPADLPPGLTLIGNTLSGTPTATGTFTFKVTATDSSTPNCLGTHIYTIVINPAGCPTITIAPPPPLSAGALNIAYKPVPFTASNGTGPYTYAITAGAQPTGLTLTGGVLSGTPTATGVFTFTVTATDTVGPPIGCSGAQIYVIVINAAPCPPITIPPTSIPTSIIIGTVTNLSLTASGGQMPYIFLVTSGSLPPGLTLSRGGTLSGMPTVAGSYTFTVQATDANGCFGARVFQISIAQVQQPQPIGTTPHGSSMPSPSGGSIPPPTPPVALSNFAVTSACVEKQGNSDKITLCLKNTTSNRQTIVATLLANNASVGQKSFDLPPNAGLCDSWVVPSQGTTYYRVNVGGVVEQDVAVCPGGSAGNTTSSSDWLLWVVIAVIVIAVIGLLVYYLMSRRSKA